MVLSSTILPYGITDHQFHISKSQIAYNTTDQALQVSMHIYVDDLEEALRRRGHDQLYINTEKEVASADSLIYQYLADVFTITIDEVNQSFNYVGKESSEDLQAIWCYLEVENIPAIQRLDLELSLLMEIYDDQKNMILVEKTNGESDYFMFTINDHADSVYF